MMELSDGGGGEGGFEERERESLEKRKKKRRRRTRRRREEDSSFSLSERAKRAIEQIEWRIARLSFGTLPWRLRPRLLRLQRHLSTARVQQQKRHLLESKSSSSRDSMESKAKSKKATTCGGGFPRETRESSALPGRRPAPARPGAEETTTWRSITRAEWQRALQVRPNEGGVSSLLDCETDNDDDDDDALSTLSTLKNLFLFLFEKKTQQQQQQKSRSLRDAPLWPLAGRSSSSSRRVETEEASGPSTRGSRPLPTTTTTAASSATNRRKQQQQRPPRPPFSLSLPSGRAASPAPLAGAATAVSPAGKQEEHMMTTATKKKKKKRSGAG